MQIEQRGTPPYYVWSGSVHVAGRKAVEQFPGEKGHKRIREDYLSAIKEMFSLTDAGQDDAVEPYIRDSEGHIVFDSTNPEDISLLRAIDKVGLHNLIVTATRE